MTDVILIFQKGLMLAVWLSFPALAVAVAVGVIVSLVQTALSVQDQALPFAVKLAAVGLTLTLTGAWLGSEILQLGDQALQTVSSLTHRTVRVK